MTDETTADQTEQRERNVEAAQEKLRRTPPLLSPDGGIYYVGDRDAPVERADSSKRIFYTRWGHPVLPDGEREISRWVVVNVAPAGTVSGLWQVGPNTGTGGEYFSGGLNVMLTDRAVRGASSDGIAQGYGKMDRGWSCFAFAIELSEIDWIAAGRRAVVFGRDDPAAIIAAKAYDRADAEWDSKVRLSSDNAEFATDLVIAAAYAQSEHPDPMRRARAQQIIRLPAGELRFDRRGRPQEFRLDR